MDLKLKNEVRAFELKQFRNIGYGDNSEDYSTLILNYSLNPEYIGDLVILIGPNNSGKSNVLDALSCFANRTISKRDFSDTRLNDENPTLKLFASSKNDKNNPIIYEYQLNKDNNFQFKDGSKIEKEPILNLDESIDNFTSENKVLFEDLMQIKNILAKHKLNVFKWKSDDEIKSYVYKNKYLSYNQVRNYLIELEKMMEIYRNCSPSKIKKWMFIIEDIKQNCSKYTPEFIEKCLDYFRQTNNHKWLSRKPPKISKYSETVIYNKNLKCTIDGLNKNRFFQHLIKISGINKKDLLKINEMYKKNHDPRIFNQYLNTYNSKFQEINNLFNKLYSTNNDSNQYSFSLQFTSPYLVFSLYRYDKETKISTSLDLEHQSTGFKWFFNFFFNVYASNEFKIGDIIIMDEPAINLHVKGQEELHDFLKKFAMQSGITFVIATHSPFLVKLDYLDEVRLIIPQSNNTSYINNSFTTVNLDDADSLLPIRKSLTVRNSVLLDPKQIVIFVEGATDYNYLVAMKKLIGNYNYLTFLPINGVGKKEDENQQKQILEKLRQIKSLNSLILIDSDPNANNFDRLNKDNKETNEQIESIQLKDINKKFSQIENVFSERDQLKFGLKNNDSPKILNKSIAGSITFKKIIQKEIWKQEDKKDYKIDVVDSDTITNFKLIFEYLTNKVKEINLNTNHIKNEK